MSQFFDIVDCDKFNQEQRKQMNVAKTAPSGRMAAGGGDAAKTAPSGRMAAGGGKQKPHFLRLLSRAGWLRRLLVRTMLGINGHRKKILSAKRMFSTHRGQAGVHGMRSLGLVHAS